MNVSAKKKCRPEQKVRPALKWRSHIFYSPGDLCAEPSVGPDADLPEKYGKKRKICIDIKLYIWYIMEYKRAVLQNRNYV